MGHPDAVMDRLPVLEVPLVFLRFLLVRESLGIDPRILGMQSKQMIM